LRGQLSQIAPLVASLIASNYVTVTLFSKTEKRVEKTNTEESWNSHIVKMCNERMGGVDVCDHESGGGTHSTTS